MDSAARQARVHIQTTFGLPLHFWRSAVTMGTMKCVCSFVQQTRAVVRTRSQQNNQRCDSPMLVPVHCRSTRRPPVRRSHPSPPPLPVDGRPSRHLHGRLCSLLRMQLRMLVA